MTRPAQRLKVAILIRPTMSFGFDVVNRSCRDWPAVSQALLADVPVTLEDACADNIPLAAVAALMSALPALMLLPAFVAMVITVARAVGCCFGAAALTAGTRDSGWHYSHQLIKNRPEAA
jgi:hypothetical protein